MILAVLASLMISTEEANTFFTTPSWMPTAICSERTPGSDDFIGFDYTIVTNVVIGAWSVKPDSKPDALGYQCWNGQYPVWNGTKWAGRVWNDGGTQVYITGSISDNFDVNTAQVDAGGFAELLVDPYDRDGWWVHFVRSVTTNITTNVHCRVDKWYGANVTATMNAMLEREYFFNAGNFSDEWATAVDGPRQNKSFWFEAIGGASPHLPFIYKSPFVAPYAKYEWSNNASWRTIESRRFVERDNLQRVVSSLNPDNDFSTSSSVDWLFVGANRLSKNGWHHWPKIVVSSTMLKSHGMNDIPEISAFTSGFFNRAWNKTSWSFGGLAFNTNIKSDHGLSHASDVIPRGLGFGWNVENYYYDTHVASQPSELNTLHYTNVLSCAKLNIEDEWKWDVSRRLSTKDLAQCNMMLSAIDRNVVATDILTATGMVTKTYYNNKWTEYEDVSVTATLEYGKYVIHSRVVPSSGEVNTTNYVTIATNYGSNVDSQFLFVSDAVEKDKAGWTVGLEAGGTILESTIISWAGDVGFVEEGGTNLVHIVGNGNASVTVTGLISSEYGVPFQASGDATVKFWHHQDNSYAYKREIAGSELGNIPHYPADRAFDGGYISSSRLNIMSAKCYAKYYGADFDQYTEGAYWCGRNKRNVLSSGNLATHFLVDGADIREDLEDNYEDRRTYGIDDWENKISIDNAHYAAIADTGTNMFVAAETELTGDMGIHGEWIYTSDGKLYECTEGGRVEIPSKEIVYSSAFTASGTCPYEYNVIKPHGDKLSFRVRKVGVVETDWNFKSMKRE